MQDTTTQYPKRIYHREWRMQHRIIRATVSLPRLQLVKPDRPIFECPVCCSCNDRVPICFWCKSSSEESKARFWGSVPKQRTISAPGGCCSKPTETEGRNVIIYNTKRPTVVPLPSLPSPSDTALALPRSVSLRQSSCHYYNSTTTATTTTTLDTTHHHLRRVDHDDNDHLDRKKNNNAFDITNDPHRRYHSLPLRRKGHLLQTTAGMIVNKTRLSALFRKDAVPVLDPTIDPPSPPPPRSQRTHHPHSRRERLKIRTEEMYHHPSPSSSYKGRSNTTVVMPTIPDDSPLPSPHTPYLMSPGVSTTSDRSQDQDYHHHHYYTTPTPPSFLSPFWYRPDQYGNLPSSPTSSSCRSGSGHPKRTVPSHSHSRSEPFPTFSRQTQPQPQPQYHHQRQPQPQLQPESQRRNKWKMRMGGFFRSSMNVVSGRHSR